MSRAVLLLLVGCGGQIALDAEPLDGGRDVPPDANNRYSPDAPARDAMQGCTPADLSAFMPALLPPPNGKHQNKCTQPQLDLYHKCVVQSDMAACSQIQALPMTTIKDCLHCLETTVMDATWGPLVCVDAMTCVLNIEGCVNLATDQTGPMSCGQLLHSAYTCQRAACEYACAGDLKATVQCMQTALKGGCKKYDDAYQTQCGDLASGFPDLDNCFRRQIETDSKALRVRMDTYFCGP